MAKDGISIEEAKKRLNENIIKAMKESVMMIEADAKMVVGVDSGDLRRSITHSVSGDGVTVSGEVGTNVEYAPHHALQNPFIETAMDSNLEAIRRNFSEVSG